MQTDASMSRRVGRLVYGLVLLAVGAALAWGGARLAWLGGSLYYLPVGLAVVWAGLDTLRGRWSRAALVYFAVFGVTLAWSLAEAGLDGWALAPRVVSPLVLGMPFIVAGLLRGKGRERLSATVAVAASVALAVGVWATSGFQPAPARAGEAKGAAADVAGDWTHFGNGPQGRHFSGLADIDRGNVGRLEVAWTQTVGPMPLRPYGQNQTVPLKVGDHLYICTALSDVLDLDPETGAIRWHYRGKADVSGLYTTKCRGVAYYAVPGATGECAQRVYTARTDARLVALDALTGKPCPGFGKGGEVDLLKGIQQRNPGYYRVTSAPVLVRGKLVVGGAVADGQHVGEPAGVVRAYDAVTGAFAWAWDPGRPDFHGEPGEGYTPGTPNSWGPSSADEELGLVYVPTGNATPDYWGGHRSPESNRHASAVVAIDVETGEARWTFQTTHYDVWDYDVASQPVLFELRRPGQPTVPALIQPTKRGQLFVLDRRSGKPLFPVVEKPAPQAGAVERLSPTQPWSTAFPDLGGPRLKESSMWGVSALDQLWCRIRFREARYEGPFTPPGVTYSIADPGYIGGVNWGSATIDTDRQLAFLVSNRLVNYIRLVPRDDPAAKDLKADSTANLGGLVAQEGTPYAADIKPFLSPLGVPCQAPPHGLINAVDLTSGRLVWARPLGSARDLGPMGVPSRLPFTIGTPTFGGAMSTAGGLVFVGASQDHAFRAFDSETGRLLFEADLPGLSATRPMTYRSTRSGRQFVVVASEAPMRNGQTYGAITAFALPGKER